MEEGRALERCPFCGAYAAYREDQRLTKAKPIRPQYFPKWYVECQECGIRTPVADIPTVTKMWNKRT